MHLLLTRTSKTPLKAMIRISSKHFVFSGVPYPKRVSTVCSPTALQWLYGFISYVYTSIAVKY